MQTGLHVKGKVNMWEGAFWGGDRGGQEGGKWREGGCQEMTLSHIPFPGQTGMAYERSGLLVFRPPPE